MRSTSSDLLSTTSPGAAAVLVPIVDELVHPQSVLDVGCGIGAWCDAFPDSVTTLGIDQRAGSEVSGPYRHVDLTAPFAVGRFDLALCLEVAEHLPESAAAGLVESLVAAAPVVLFGAAIPGQHGTGHVNCQWPDWWAARFAAHGYRQYDCVRHRVWDDDRVAYWYAQNTFLYSATHTFAEERLPERLVHPALWSERIAEPISDRGVRELSRALSISATRSLRSRLGSRR